jgi:hypothetical protein
MTTPGWIIMLTSVGAVTTLFILCLYRVLTHKPPSQGLHGIDDISTGNGDKD